MWDTAGQERYQSLGIAFYKGAECCLLVYDITSSKSFETLANWKSEFLRQAAPRNPDAFPFVVLGNKADREQERKVSTAKVENWCKQNGGMKHFETSAKDQTNVDKAFETAARLALENQMVTMYCDPCLSRNVGPSCPSAAAPATNYLRR